MKNCWSTSYSVLCLFLEGRPTGERLEQQTAMVSTSPRDLNPSPSPVDLRLLDRQRERRQSDRRSFPGWRRHKCRRISIARSKVWKWHPGKTDIAANRSNAANPTPNVETPSIAVLPFTNMSGDPEQEYFSDGISEDVITDLSKIAGLLVISRNSSFTYKGRSVDIRAVGRDCRALSA